MSKQLQRENQSLFAELMSWMNSTVDQPQVRIEEWVDGDRRFIRVDLPGVDPEKDLELSIDGDMLQLRGERRAEEHHRHRTEIRYGSFARSIPLPPGTRAEDISAEYAKGQLTVSMPAGDAGGSRKIPITRTGS
ncbi:Hsp20 family protein [Nocardioides sp. dk4132]|uniref:Hsp20/alpha crystallin family protein n=1 Tax=unclassified Nocardioides TaxID=2615069 RepID=UPI001294DF35|nr:MULTISPECIES: Hsp20/alpha crystallin family protein [unclassified Nocardioides]MQW77862.1 Hsp20 family protein [Nocardioides sp. dk4132]QGA08252.1 Hsp20 family protein [Nocardioides sp. dk884]